MTQQVVVHQESCKQRGGWYNLLMVKIDDIAIAGVTHVVEYCVLVGYVWILSCISDRV